ncbi:MAG TPA: hypothetical protein VF734_18705 [Pseudonocardiaceae bacterium]
MVSAPHKPVPSSAIALPVTAPAAAPPASTPRINDPTTTTCPWPYHTRWFTQVGTGRPGRDSSFCRDTDGIALDVLTALDR